MSNIKQSVNEFEQKVEHTFTSGQPGTTGREPFEEPTGTFGGAGGRGETGHHGLGQHGTGAGSTGVGSGLRGAENEARGAENLTTHSHEHRSGQGLTGQQGQYGQESVGSRTAGGADDYVRSHGGAKDGSSYDDYNRGTGAGAGTGSGLGSGGVGDRTGNLNQGGAAYERSTDQGPITGGAAGTDRFDSDRHRSSGTTGTTGHPSAFDRTGDDRHATDSKAGGLLSGATTTDSEFTGRDRSHKTGTGAYADSDGTFQDNTSGPGGNTALTGREGNLDNNPVAQTKSGEGLGSTHAGTGTHQGVDSSANPQESKGIFQKIKEIL